MLMQAQRRGTGLALPIFNLGARRGWMVIMPPWPLCPTEGALVHIVEEAEWASEIIWMGREKRKYFAPTRVRTLDHPAHSKPLYCLCYFSPSSSTLLLRIHLTIHILAIYFGPYNCVLTLLSLFFTQENIFQGFRKHMTFSW